MNLQITRLQPQKRKKGRFNLFTEDGFLTSLSYETILKFGIRENGCIESERLEQAKQDDTVKYAKEQAMQYVAYAPRSSSQVRKRLQQKGVDEQSINCALETMRRYGYIDDAAYIREFVRSYSAKLGEQAIRQKLLQNGVAGSLIDEVLELPEQTQLEAARACLRKKLPACRQLEPQKARQRLYGALARRGFSAEIIRHAMEEELIALEQE